MKLLVLIVEAAGCLVSESTFAGLEQNDSLAELFPRVLTNWNGNGEPLKIPMRPGRDTNTLNFTGTNWANLGTMLALPFWGGTNIMPDLAGRKALTPGVYLSKPYTCLVIVPDAPTDPVMLIDSGTGVDTKMPTIQPQVEYAPWRGAAVKEPAKSP